MIITTTVYLTADGGIRMASRSDSRPRKGELTATLELDVPESLFQPQSVTLRATVAGAAPTVVPAVPTSVPVRNGNVQPPAKPDAESSVWTATRIRRVQSLSGMDDDTFARKLNVSIQILGAWKNAGKPLKLSAVDMNRLEAIEAEAMTA